ncbi:daunorubicin C-13 ketoreductase [Immersiella caudata]|uniref:Daunorubicin C-13 ketoreductase n=1 Tax=Immersiella caudata TaxID=314043 RepID=A0AA39WLB4_9PEZI|nr:daunorubicin C-13 ketoreductase [Immersiella caudata]
MSERNIRVYCIIRLFSLFLSSRILVAMAQNWDPLRDMPQLHGKVALVTGGNAGIGFETVKFLALRGAKVYLAARNEGRATTAIEKLLAENPTLERGRLPWLPLDLADPKAVVGATNEMKKKEQRLDILVNNAGIGTQTFQLNKAGWEMTMAVCHVGHFILTLGLMPLLEQAAKDDREADVRIITLSSIITTVMVPSDLDFGFKAPAFLHQHRTFSTIQSRILGWLAFTVDMPRYAMAKTANILFAQELQRRLETRGLGDRMLSLSLHPGGVGTEGAMTIFTALVKPLVWLSAVPPDKGAVTSLFAATADAVRANRNTYKGKFLVPYGEIAPLPAVADDPVQVRGLWDNTLAAVNEYLVGEGFEPIQDL